MEPSIELGYETQKDETLPYYNAELKQLSGSVKGKVRKLLRLNLVKPIGGNRFVIEPIEGYNSNTYYVDIDGDFICTCQKAKGCAHIYAVKLGIFQGRWKDGYGLYK